MGSDVDVVGGSSRQGGVVTPLPTWLEWTLGQPDLWALCLSYAASPHIQPHGTLRTAPVDKVREGPDHAHVCPRGCCVASHQPICCLYVCFQPSRHHCSPPCPSPCPLFVSFCRCLLAPGPSSWWCSLPFPPSPRVLVGSRTRHPHPCSPSCSSAARAPAQRWPMLPRQQALEALENTLGSRQTRCACHSRVHCLCGREVRAQLPSPPPFGGARFHAPSFFTHRCHSIGFSCLHLAAVCSSSQHRDDTMCPPALFMQAPVAPSVCRL